MQKLNSKNKKLHLRRTGICKAELQQDAPFAIAIGACMLNSLLFTGIGESLSEDDEDGVIGATDARFSVMTIISLIPYFNWLVSSKILKLLTDFEMQIDNMTYDLENAYIFMVFGIHFLLEVFGLVLWRKYICCMKIFFQCNLQIINGFLLFGLTKTIPLRGRNENFRGWKSDEKLVSGFLSNLEKKKSVEQ